MIPLVEKQVVCLTILMSRKFNGGIQRRMDSMVDDRPRVLICALLSLFIRRLCSYSLFVIGVSLPFHMHMFFHVQSSCCSDWISNLFLGIDRMFYGQGLCIAVHIQYSASSNQLNALSVATKKSYFVIDNCFIVIFGVLFWCPVSSQFLLHRLLPGFLFRLAMHRCHFSAYLITIESPCPL